MGLGLILLLIAVYPANIYLAFNDSQQAIGISSFMASWMDYHSVLLIGLALVLKP